MFFGCMKMEYKTHTHYICLLCSPAFTVTMLVYVLPLELQLPVSSQQSIQQVKTHQALM